MNITRKLAEVIAIPDKYTDLRLANKTVELLLLLLENWQVRATAAPSFNNEDYNLITRTLETAFRKNSFIAVEEIARIL